MCMYANGTNYYLTVFYRLEAKQWEKLIALQPVLPIPSAEDLPGEVLRGRGRFQRPSCKGMSSSSSVLSES